MGGTPGHLRLLPAALVAALALALPGPAAAGTIPVAKPDLRMAPIPASRVKLCTPDLDYAWTCTRPKPGEEAWLRFDALVVNVGAGPFELKAKRMPDRKRLMAVRQIIRRADGTKARERRTEAVARYEKNDTHRHWHTLRFEGYRLHALSGELKGKHKGRKMGFCFFDGARWVAEGVVPAASRFRFEDCGTKKSQKIHVGLSVGRGDLYPWQFWGQYIDVTNVPAGEYLLCQTADPQNHFRETDDGNNDAWAKIRLVDPASPDGRRSVEFIESSADTSCAEELQSDETTTARRGRALGSTGARLASFTSAVERPAVRDPLLCPIVSVATA